MGHKQPTRPAQVTIAERRRPRPEGLPGYLRVDSVHPGDLDKVKGVYHIDVVDAVTQYQLVGSAERISEHYLASDNYFGRRIASQRVLPGRGRCLTICVTQGDTRSSVSTQRGRSYRLPVASIATPS